MRKGWLDEEDVEGVVYVGDREKPLDTPVRGCLTQGTRLAIQTFRAASICDGSAEERFRGVQLEHEFTGPDRMIN